MDEVLLILAFAVGLLVGLYTGWSISDMRRRANQSPPPLPRLVPPVDYGPYNAFAINLGEDQQLKVDGEGAFSVVKRKPS